MSRLSRGLRNRNPGNIRRSAFRYVGEVANPTDREFRQFENIAYGYRALFVLLHTYARRHRCHTIRAIINRYAPPSENNTEGYIARVVRLTSIGADEPIDTLCHDTMVALVAAISEVENGTKAVMEDIEAGWRLFGEQGSVAPQ